MNGADLAVLVVPFPDGSSNRVEAGTDLEALLVVFSVVVIWFYSLSPCLGTLCQFEPFYSVYSLLSHI